MRTPSLSLTRKALVVAAVSVGLVGLAVADNTSKRSSPVPQKAISQPFLESLVGQWTGTSKGLHEGKETAGTSKSSWTRELGGTAIVQVYEGTMPGPDGKMSTFYGHGVYKLSDDGKTATLWWFCNMSPDVLRLSGTVSDSGLKVSGDSPEGGRVEVAFERGADGLTFRIKDGANEMRETYTPSK